MALYQPSRMDKLKERLSYLINDENNEYYDTNNNKLSIPINVTTGYKLNELIDCSKELLEKKHNTKLTIKDHSSTLNHFIFYFTKV